MQISGKGKLLDAFLSERRLIPVGRATLLSSQYNAGGKQFQRRSMHAESLIKRWGGVTSNAVAESFARSSFWSLYGADVSGYRSLCTSGVGAEQLGGVLNAAVEAGELVEEATSVAVDQVSGSEDRLDFTGAASPEGEGDAETDSSGDKETDEIVSKMDAAGTAYTLQQCF